MANKFCDYMMRHLHLGGIGLNIVDSYCDDVKTESTGEARKRLLEIYTPPVFSCTTDNKISERKWNLQIVIPMFNSEKYIVECIDSILMQNTKYTYRLIVIDDGSTDNAVELLRSTYSPESFELICQSNQGTASARNVGLKNICADYVMFVDADDVITPGTIDAMLDVAYSNKANIVEGGYEVFDNGITRQHDHEYGQVSELCGKLWGFAWAKVIKAELLQNICFPYGYWYEDTIISYILYTKCTNAITIPNTVYRYRRNKNGFSHIRGNQTKLLDTFWVFDNIIMEMLASGVKINAGMYHQVLKSMILSSKRLMYMSDIIRRDVLEVFSDMLNSAFAGFSSECRELALFEKVVRNNDFDKYCRVVDCIQ